MIAQELNLKFRLHKLTYQEIEYVRQKYTNSNF